MKIIIDRYPTTTSFETNKKLPKYKNTGTCMVRTKLARKHLENVSYEVAHQPGDFFVEVVEQITDGEIWHLGS